MTHSDAVNDPILHPLLRAGSEEERQSLLETVLTGHAYERIDRALDSRYRQSSLSPHHREDLRAEILLRLVNRLHALAHDADAEPILSFGDYVAVVTFNTFDAFLRRSYPLRSKVKNRVRYALRHDPRLAEWQSNRDLVAGLAEWKDTTLALDSIEAPADVPRSSSDLRELLVTLLRHAGRPVLLNGLVAAVADLYDARDALQALPPADASTSRDISADLANAAFLREVWREICELPLNQRVALLLNARDEAGESVLRFLPVTGVATARQIGQTLAIEAVELAEIWRELPLEDTKIAVILQVTRQQVINLRQAARNRLTRRLRKEPGKKGRTP